MSLLSALSVSASGMAAQRTRSELLVENIANSETTRTAEGGPYRRKDAIFSSTPVPSAFSSLLDEQMGDRKSTRLNSSHPSISYAVFCLKKKNIIYCSRCVYIIDC